jgi:hypothetical protein
MVRGLQHVRRFRTNRTQQPGAVGQSGVTAAIYWGWLVNIPVSVVFFVSVSCCFWLRWITQQTGGGLRRCFKSDGWAEITALPVNRKVQKF